MPIYEYQCTACNHHLELMQKVSEQPSTVCPACSNSSLTRLVSAAGFQLKGTGWYVTDFKDKKNTANNAASSTSSSQESTGNEKTAVKQTASTGDNP
ncbi:MAG: FmdB family zinc ribbon protein [Legionella sp.]